MRPVAERIRFALGGARRARAGSPDELPAAGLPHVLGSHEPAKWVSSRPSAPRERAPIVASIRGEPDAAIWDRRRPSALGTLLEGAMAFALDDAVDGRCREIEVRLLRDGSARVHHEGPGFCPPRASAGMQRWPWLRRSPEGEVVLTRSFAAPVVTCALSHWCRLEIRRRDGTHRQAFYRGRPECPLRFEASPQRDTGTCVHFRPDKAVFGDLRFDLDDLYMRGLGLALDLPGVGLRVIDERCGGRSLEIAGMSQL